jgi:hypothetical protein
VSTRPRKQAGAKTRGWTELNQVTSCGLMESEVWYIALMAVGVGETDKAKETLENQFGSLESASHAYRSLADGPAAKFKDVADAFDWSGDN